MSSIPLNINTSVESGAGCGKTYNIIESIVSGLAKEEFSMDSIAVITFTRKAAAELKTRIVLRLRKESNKNKKLNEQLDRMGNAHITTIHAFCTGLLKERPVEAGVDPAFEVLESTDAFFEQAYDDWLKIQLDQNESFFRTILIDYQRELKKSDSSFSFSDNSFQGLLKKAVDNRQVDFFVPEEPSQEELNNIIQELIALCETVSSKTDNEKLVTFFEKTLISLNSLHKFDGSYQDKLNMYNAGKSSFSARAGGRSEEIKAIRDHWNDDRKPIAARLEHYCNYAINYKEIKAFYIECNDIIKNFITFYRKRLYQTGQLDFAEILIKTTELLQTSIEARKYFKERFQFIFIDEFQDTDPLQAQVIYYLSEKIGQESKEAWQKLDLETGKLMIVGDPKQAIYRFRRADIEIYAQVRNKIIENSKESEITLAVNYRSSKSILNWVNRHFSKSIIESQDGYYQPAYFDMKPYAKAIAGEKITFVEPKNYDVEFTSIDKVREVEAKLTARCIRHIIDEKKYKPGQIMVLFRNKNNINAIFNYLEALDIPVEAEGAALFFRRTEVLHSLNLLKAILNPLDHIAIVATLKGPIFSLPSTQFLDWQQKFDYRNARSLKDGGDHPVEQSLYQLSNWHKAARNTSAALLLDEIYIDHALYVSASATYQGRQKALNMLKLIEYLSAFNNKPFAYAVRQFAEAVDNEDDSPQFKDISDDDTGRVQLMTVHAAKGLESEVVYIADATSNSRNPDDFFTDSESNSYYYFFKKEHKSPLYNRLYEKERLKTQAEEERLRYVAATRPKELLYINRIEYSAPRAKSSKCYMYSLWQSDHSDLAQTLTLDIADVNYDPGFNLDLDEHLKIKAADKVFFDFDKEQKQIKNISKISKSLQDKTREIQSPSASQPDSKDSENGENTDNNIELIMPLVTINEDGLQVSSDISASEVGNLIHKMLELDSSEPEFLAKILITEANINLDVPILVDYYKKIKQAVADDLHKATKIYRELPLVFRSKNGTYYNGSIDLLYQLNGDWHLVDYKTTKEKDATALQKQYAAQLSLYQEGLALVGIDVKDENCKLLGQRLNIV